MGPLTRHANHGNNINHTGNIQTPGQILENSYYRGLRTRGEYCLFKL